MSEQAAIIDDLCRILDERHINYERRCDTINIRRVSVSCRTQYTGDKYWRRPTGEFSVLLHNDWCFKKRWKKKPIDLEDVIKHLLSEAEISRSLEDAKDNERRLDNAGQQLAQRLNGEFQVDLVRNKLDRLIVTVADLDETKARRLLNFLGEQTNS